MLIKESLFVLIKSLSKSEKRYFRLFCTREASGSNYLQLFDAIARQSVYDEKALKDQFKNKRFTRQLHVTKNYLGKLILKSLRNFHAGISRDAELKDVLRNIEILYNKELFEHCESQLQVADRLAKKYELLPGQLEIDNWKRKLEQTRRPGNYHGLTEVLEGQEVTLKKLRNHLDYWQLAVEVTAKIFRDQNITIRNKSLLNNPENALSLEARVLYYNTTYLNHLQNNESEKAERELRTLLSLLEGSPDRLKEEPGLYVSSINNLVSFFVFNRKYEDAIVLIQKAKKIYRGWKVTSENRTLLKQIMRTYNIELEIYRNTKDFEGQRTFIDSTEIFVTDNLYKIPKDYVASFQFQLASIHFMRNDLKKSLHWINKFLNARFKDVRADLKKQVLILNLMVHLEQRNLMVLGYYVNSTRRYMNKVKRLLPYEEILLKFFIRIGRTPLLEYKEAFRSLKRQLYPENADPLIPREVIGYIDYKAWINRELGIS
ncbi:MAG TPA: hypothetical protein VKN36_14650 [Eudoraea sp.]|nr:hypothetical protein [Eudoraea sp.]